MRCLDFRKNLIRVRKLIEKTCRLQKKLEAHVAKIDRHQARKRLAKAKMRHSK